MDLAALMGVFPAFAQVSAGQAVLVGEPRIGLPHGDELSDAEQLEVEGEVFWLAVIPRELVVGALVGWLTYREVGDVMEFTIAGVGAMIAVTIGWGVAIPR